MSDTDRFDYVMPSLGADMDEGRVIEWRVAAGDAVHRGDLIAVVETEKSDIDIEIWHDGIIEEFLVDVGQLVDVGTPIARLRSIGGTAPRPRSAPRSGPLPTPLDRWPTSVFRRHRSLGRLATERGIDLRTLRGTGPGGAVIEADVAVGLDRHAASRLHRGSDP